MKTTIGKPVLAALVASAMFVAPAHAATKHVDCDKGQTLSKAIDSASANAALLEIMVSGKCNETVTIRRSNVSIYGDPFAVINGTVQVFSVTTVRLFDLIITGPGDGLATSGSVDVWTDRVSLVGNERTGLALRRNSNVFFRNGLIFGNCDYPEDEDCGDGVTVEDSMLTLHNSFIFNARYGVAADVGSRLILQGLGGNVTEIAYNTVVGVQVGLHSIVDMRGNTRLHDNRYHAVFAYQDSAVRISDSNVGVVGNIGCMDEESSFVNWGGGSITGTDCSGF